MIKRLTLPPGTRHLCRYDPLDVKDLTNAEMEGRELSMVALKALRHSLPGFEKAKLRNFGMTLGVRDTRKIVGRYCLTSDDVRNQASRLAGLVRRLPQQRPVLI